MHCYWIIIAYMYASPLMWPTMSETADWAKKTILFPTKIENKIRRIVWWAVIMLQSGADRSFSDLLRSSCSFRFTPTYSTSTFSTIPKFKFTRAPHFPVVRTTIPLHEKHAQQKWIKKKAYPPLKKGSSNNGKCEHGWYCNERDKHKWNCESRYKFWGACGDNDLYKSSNSDKHKYQKHPMNNLKKRTPVILEMSTGTFSEMVSKTEEIMAKIFVQGHVVVNKLSVKTFRNNESIPKTRKDRYIYVFIR